MAFRRLNEATLMACALLVASGAPTAAADDLCGATILADLKLDHDLTCPGNGLIAGSDGITIDLNGHTITGPGSGVGIAVPSRTGVVIRGGTVRNFLVGVQLTGADANVIREMRATGNRDGIFLIGSSGNTIKENLAWQNSRVGVMLRPGSIRNSTQNLVKENTLTDNLNGIILVETPSGNTIKENIVSGSGTAGIALNGGVSANVIKENSFTGNAAAILFNAVAGLTPTGNGFVENTIAMNTCGFQGPSSGNTFKENVLVGNTADACP
jgi:parallel beta-helix repeat protein